jgi:riboflavin synthase alpha subunit
VFTGIVTHRGEVLAAERARGRDGGVTLRVRPLGPLPSLRVGDSVAVDGVCLTVASLGADGLAFDVVPETLRRTTIGEFRAGRVVHVEPALRAGDPLGGHLVEGHVGGVGTVSSVERRGEDVRMTVGLPEGLEGAVMEKGAVALDGVSLTVGEVLEDGRSFAVYLIPHTLAVTELGSRRPGSRVNVEPDLLGRWVEHHVRRLLEDR